MAPRKKQKPPPPPPRERTPREIAEDARNAHLHETHPHPVYMLETVRQLVEDIRSGQFRLPPFQRALVWTDEQVLLLLDSVYQGFHIGTMFFWESYSILPEVPAVYGTETTDLRPRGYLVCDGQQRMAALAKALLTDRFFYDCQEERFVIDQESSPRYLPLQMLLSAGLSTHKGKTLLNWIDEGGDIFYAGRLGNDLIYRTVHSMKMPYGWEIANVVEMFRRINTAGTPLTASEIEGALTRAVSVEIPRTSK